MMQELLNVVQHNYNNTSSSSINSSNSLSSPSSTSDQPPQQNLRCPRCDSPNTKFCYYNNYNLTQPRHFCKTCRRYWTKGGALRNVPIGGGCRKSRTATVMSASDKPKPKPRPMMSASDLVGLGSGSNLQLPPGLAPYSSHLLALLKASTQMQNPNSYRIKEEMISAPQQMQQNFWNSNMDQFERAGNYNVGFNSNASYYFPSFAAANTTAMSSSTAAAMEPVSTHSGDTMSWSDISASNGAYY